MILRNEAELEQGKIEKEKETRIIEKTNERLKELVPNDAIYEAMENFLLGDPESQIPQLGSPDVILGKAGQRYRQRRRPDRPRPVRDDGQNRNLPTGS